MTYCWAAIDGSDDGDHLDCLRLTVERMRPVVDAARVALATIDRLNAADEAWLASDVMTTHRLHELYDEANEETTAVLGVLRGRLDAFDGKDPTHA